MPERCNEELHVVTGKRIHTTPCETTCECGKETLRVITNWEGTLILEIGKAKGA